MHDVTSTDGRRPSPVRSFSPFQIDLMAPFFLFLKIGFCVGGDGVIENTISSFPAITDWVFENQD